MLAAVQARVGYSEGVSRDAADGPVRSAVRSGGRVKLGCKCNRVTLRSVLCLTLREFSV